MARIGPRMRLATILAVLALPVLIAARLGRRVERPEEREAHRWFREGRYDRAEEALGRWLSASPGSVEAHLLKGRVAVARNRLAEAAGELKLAISLGGKPDDLLLLRALIAAKAGRHIEAEPALRRAFDEAREPDRQVDEALGRVYLETYDLKRAASVLDRWADDFPDDARPHLWRAEIHGRDGNESARVLDDYREALRRDPSLAIARLGLAQALRKAHRNAEAAVAYEDYLALRPDDAAAHLGAGQNLGETGDEPAARRHLLRAIELDDKNAAALTELAQLCSRRGDWAGALAHLDRAIALDPYEVGVRHQRSMALARLGRSGEARAEQALASRLRDDLKTLGEARSRLVATPNDRSSQLEVARWMFAHGHDQEGARWAEKILAERPRDPDASRMLADYHDRRGEKGLANRYRLDASTGSAGLGAPRRSSGRPLRHGPTIPGIPAPSAAIEGSGSMRSVFGRILKVATDRRGARGPVRGGLGRADRPGPVHVAPAGQAMARDRVVARVVPDQRHRSRPSAGDEAVPPFSDITFDDSGYATAIRFSKPDRRPDVAGADRRLGRGPGPPGDRVPGGQARQPAAGRSGDPFDGGQHPPADRLAATCTRANGTEASAQFALAQTADPARSALFRANLDALRGVAALRRGEIENCVACCNESSCIFPLAAAAVHRRTSGSREAIEHFTRYLRAAAGGPGGPVAPERRLHDAGRVPGRCPRRLPPAAGPVRRGGGRPAADGQRGVPRRAQRAGRVDGRRLPGRRLRRRRPAGRLHAHDRPRARGPAAAQPRRRHVRGRLGPGRPHRPGPVAERLPRRLRQRRRTRHPDAPRRLGGPPADVAACGIAAACSRTSRCPPGSASRSPRRRPAGPITTTTATSTSTSPASSTPARPDPRNRGRLYHNRGDGTFEDVAAAAGVTNDRFGKGVAWGDYDDDGRPDLYVSNLGQPNRLYHNQGDGTFVDVAAVLRVTEPIYGFACWFWDYDNDGRLDLWVNPNRATLSEVIRGPARPADVRRAAPALSQRRRHGDLPRRDRGGRARPGRPADGLELRRPGQRRVPRYLPGDRPAVVRLPDAQRAVPERRRPAVRGHHRGDRDRPPPEGARRGLRRLGPRRRRSTSSSRPAAPSRATGPTTSSSRTRATATTG